MRMLKMLGALCLLLAASVASIPALAVESLALGAGPPDAAFTATMDCASVQVTMAETLNSVKPTFSPVTDPLVHERLQGSDLRHSYAEATLPTAGHKPEVGWRYGTSVG